MKCPQCKAKGLSPTRLEPSLGALACGACGGTLLNLVSYRLWQELHEGELNSEVELTSQPDQPSGALLCAKCSRIMLKFQYTTDSSHVLDVCSYCEDVWFQENEWEYLRSLLLHGELPKIFTEPWQRNLRARRTSETLEREWDRRLGPELHSRIREIDSWLREHPDRASILDYLVASDPYST